MARLLIIAIALLGAVCADDSGYNAPSAGGYGAPSNGYGAPATDDGYGIPTSYEQPTGYQTAPADAGGDLFNLDKIIELVPFFLAVFAAIIIAQLFAPLLGVLFDAKVGLLAPFGNAKIDLFNAILTPFNLSLCTITPLALAGTNGRNADFRSFSNFDAESVMSLLSQAYEAYSS